MVIKILIIIDCCQLKSIRLCDFSKIQTNQSGSTVPVPPSVLLNTLFFTTERDWDVDLTTSFWYKDKTYQIEFYFYLKKNAVFTLFYNTN